MMEATGEKVLFVEPQSALWDERVFISCQGLERGERVTVRVSTVDDVGTKWSSSAEYVATGYGVVEPHRQPPASGSYQGVEPWGLFWSMTPADGSHTQFRKSSADPLTYEITAEAGGSQFGSSEIERIFTAPGVKAISPGQGIEGVFFTPASGQPSPGVVVLHGTDARVHEELASLLASRGFAALALKYIGGEGQPGELINVPVECVGEAVNWLSDRPEVSSGVGLLGLSRGGELALLAASHFPKIGAVVSYSGSCVAWEGLHSDPRAPGTEPAWSFEGKPVPFLARTDTFSFKIRAIWGSMTHRAFSTRVTYSGAMKDQAAVDRATIEVEAGDAALLMVAGGRDMVWPSAELSRIAVDRLDSTAGARPHELLLFDNAGHGQGIPYRPSTVRQTVTFAGTMLEFGGTAPDNAHADEESWARTLSFFKDNLG